MGAFAARIPLVRLLVPLCVGIAVGYAFRIHVPLLFFVFGIGVCVGLLFLHRKLLQRSLRWMGFDGINIALALFLAGMGSTSLQLEENFPGIKNTAQSLEVCLLNDPVVKEKSVKLMVGLRSWKDSAGWKAGDEKMIVYLARNAAAEKLKYGDEILIHAAPEAIEGPKNPEEFDYRAWLERLDIRRQVYAKTNDWKFLSADNGNAFKATALNLRRYFLGKLQTYGLSGSAYGVAAALLLGSSDHLDPGTIQSYSASGTLHVLSVSGMHVALVYVVLLKLLVPLEKRKGGKWMSIVLQLVFLWFYATLTGLCPSVLRSVTMLSVVVAGRAFNRNAHILNSLAASALILLLCNPLLLFDIGFQLSYLAVAGIVILQPKLESMYEPKLWLTQQTWTLVSVTLVAQVFTFPLGLYYFHQFPTYFLLSNLVVIPLSTIAMYAGLALLIASPLALLAKPIAFVFGFLLQLLNGAVALIEHLPFSVMHSAKWEKMEMLLLYLFIVSMLLFILRKNKTGLQLGLGSFLLLLVCMAYGNNNLLNKQSLVIFHVKHATALAVVYGKQHTLFADTTLIKRPGDIDFHIDPFLEANGMDDEKIISLQDSVLFRNEYTHFGKSWLMLYHKKILVAGRGFNTKNDMQPCDILLLCQNTNAKLDTLLARTKPALVIADASNGKKKIAKWKSICEKQNVKFYDVGEEGAFVLDE